MTTDTPDTTQGERFEIRDERGAAWYLRRLRAIDDERAAVTAATEQRVAELDADRRRLEHLYGDQLEAWARQEAQRRRRKTVTVPLAGMAIAFRTAPARVEVQDQDAARDVALTLGYVKTAPDLCAYRKAAAQALADRGELLPGCRVVEESERVTVRRIEEKTTGEEASTD